MKKIYFDIGANDGTNSIFVTNDPNAVVFAFEPNPLLAKHLRDHTPGNYLVFECAVSDYTGKANFNICESADRGCSSLLELSEKALTEWGGRQDMVPTQKTEVDVIRLYYIINMFGIEEIEYFHCDAQGSDLNVLKGMGEHIRKIKGGVVEAAGKDEILYKDQNSAKDTINYLESYGFKIVAINGNDVQGNEFNIHFTRA